MILVNLEKTKQKVQILRRHVDQTQVMGFLESLVIGDHLYPDDGRLLSHNQQNVKLLDTGVKRDGLRGVLRNGRALLAVPGVTQASPHFTL